MDGTFTFKRGSENMHIDEVMVLLSQTHWACRRHRDTVERAIANSLCFGIFDENDVQIGFGRALTDYATAFYLSDIVVDTKYRNNGLGEKLIAFIRETPELYHLWGFLGTTNAAAFYEKCGFKRKDNFFMALPRTNVDDIFNVY